VRMVSKERRVQAPIMRSFASAAVKVIILEDL
jgi:hypothetical protein